MNFFIDLSKKFFHRVSNCVQLHCLLSMAMFVFFFLGTSSVTASEKNNEIVLINKFDEIFTEPSEQDIKVDVLPKVNLGNQKRLFREYSVMVDCALFLGSKSERLTIGRQGIISDGLLEALVTCTGYPLSKNQKRYTQFVVIATMPVVYDLFLHEQWVLYEKRIMDNVDIYSSDDKAFVVFIPKGYKKDAYESHKKDNLKVVSREEFIGFDKKSLHPLDLNKIKSDPDIKKYQDIQNEEGKIDIAKLKSMFELSNHNVARCVYLTGHGSYKRTIADMDKKNYLQFINVLEDIDTRFLYVDSCYAGGIDTIELQTSFKGDFDINHIHFPIVVQANVDEYCTGRCLVHKNENELFFLNDFFSALHAYLSSNYMDVTEEKPKCIWRLQQKNIMLGEELIEKTEKLKKLEERVKSLQKSPDWDPDIPKNHDYFKQVAKYKNEVYELNTSEISASLVTIKDVLRPMYLQSQKLVNLPSIYIPCCQELPQGLFFQAIKVDTMEVITNQNLAEQIVVSDSTSKRTGNKKEMKYVLMYPVDMSKTVFEVNAKKVPQFVSMMGGDAYHVIRMIDAHQFNMKDILNKGFFYVLDYSIKEKKFSMGKSKKAWFIQEIKGLDACWKNVVIYKPETQHETSEYVGFAMYKYDNRYYEVKINIEYFKEGSEPTCSFGKPEEISGLCYADLLEKISYCCTPDFVALEKFSGSRENLQGVYKSLSFFVSSAISFPINYGLDEIKKEVGRVYNVEDRLPIEISTRNMFLKMLQKKLGNEVYNTIIAEMLMKKNAATS